MQADLQPRRSPHPRRETQEPASRPNREKRSQRLLRRNAVQLAEAQLEIRDWMSRQR